jgi:beta-glucanase (GH16 family)
VPVTIRKAVLLTLGAATIGASTLVGGSASNAAVVSPPTCGGVSIAKASGGNWQCTFDDEFSSNTLDTTKWTIQQTSNSGYHSGKECFTASPNNVSIANGVLSLTARKEAAQFYCASPLIGYLTSYTSGMVSTKGKFSQAYGRFEVRAKLPPATIKGLQESFWLWPDNSTKYGLLWPQSGEIDIAEVYSQYADRAIPYIHYTAGAVDPNVTNNYCLISDISQFHSYVVEWTPNTITVIYDGTTCLVDSWTPGFIKKPAPFDQPFFVNLTQALGITTNAFDPTTTPLPATTQVDYVRVWK